MTVQHIVVGADGSAGSTAAVQWVAELAAQLDAKVTVVHVFEPLAQLGAVEPPYDIPSLEAAARAQLEGPWTEPLADARVVFTTELVEGDPAAALAEVADHTGADLIVVGDRGYSSVRRLVLGSTAMKLPHETRHPVAIIRAPKD